MVRQLSSPAPAGPVRTCIGCRRRAAKRELLRVTAGSDADGRPAVVPDPRATAPGRGAHLHPTIECYDLAVRHKAFGRALRADPGLRVEAVGDHLRALAQHDQQHQHDQHDQPGDVPRDDVTT